MFETKRKKKAPVEVQAPGKSKLKSLAVPQLPASMEGAEAAVEKIEEVLVEETQEEKKAAVIKLINRNMKMTSKQRQEEGRCGCW